MEVLPTNFDRPRKGINHHKSNEPLVGEPLNFVGYQWLFQARKQALKGAWVTQCGAAHPAPPPHQ